MIEVINFHQYKSQAALTAAFGNRWLYVGRANGRYGLPASPLANPFVSNSRKRGTVVADPVDAYRSWLWRKMKDRDTAVMETLGRIRPDTRLVCWCKPHDCHGDVIAAAVAWAWGNGVITPE
jgi:hypothetical protein